MSAPEWSLEGGDAGPSGTAPGRVGRRRAEWGAAGQVLRPERMGGLGMGGVLLHMVTLEAICDHGVSVAFRQWKRPGVQAGGTLLTALGEMKVRDVREVAVEDVTPAAAGAAGFAGRDELLAVPAERPDATLYRIDLADLRPDPCHLRSVSKRSPC